jgi:geranylgeranyl diphosphate synthase, type I
MAVGPAGAPAKKGASGRTAPQLLAWSRQAIDPDLRAAVDSLPASMRQIAGYHFGWWNERGEPVEADPGKSIRPALALLSASAVGSDPEAALPAAVAVELVHSFSVVHDDVMDGDLTRRHRPTVWKTFGRPAAILAGDALLTLAFDVLASSRSPGATQAARMLSAAVQDLVDGQSADLAFEQRSDVSLDECVRMAERKTAALLGCSCALGGLLANGSAEQVERLRGFGERLGLAFQFVDDLLGIWGDPAVTGKPVYSDLRNGKKSLPVVAALGSGTPAARKLAALFTREASLADADLFQAAELVEQAGGRAWSRAQADQQLRTAIRHLAAVLPEAQAGKELGALARYVVLRDR